MIYRTILLCTLTLLALNELMLLARRRNRDVIEVHVLACGLVLVLLLTPTPGAVESSLTNRLRNRSAPGDEEKEEQHQFLPDLLRPVFT
jgi:hypothetical protein